MKGLLPFKNMNQHYHGSFIKLTQAKAHKTVMNIFKNRMAKLSKQKKGLGEQDMTRNIIIGVSIAVALVAGGAGAFALIKRNQMKKESMSNAEL